jgi:hypothetical protein
MRKGPAKRSDSLPRGFDFRTPDAPLDDPPFGGGNMTISLT